MEQIAILVGEYVGTFLLLASFFVPMVIEAFFTYVWQPAGKFLNSLMTIFIAVAVTFVAWPISQAVGVGFLSEINVWWHVLLNGLGAGIIANWTWIGIDFVKMIITFIITLQPKVLAVKRK